MWFRSKNGGEENRPEMLRFNDVSPEERVRPFLCIDVLNKGGRCRGNKERVISAIT